MKRIQLQPAYVLSARAYRDTSLLLEVFTADHGRVGLVARGARALKSRLRGLLQPFQPLLLSWSDRGDLGTLSGAESGGRGRPLRGEAIFSGWYLNELMLRLLQRRDPHPALFGQYAAALAALGDRGATAALRTFEKSLLAELGYGLQLPDDLAGDRWYAYEPESGLRAAEPGPEHYAGASLLALQAGRFDTEQSLRDARRLLRAALAPHLGHRALRTPELLRALRAATQGRRS
jgi:DNA repair protein RecO (recombination protein O)